MQQMSLMSPRAATRARTGSALPDAKTTDPRWLVLSYVQQARRDLGISDREIAVLRGLLTFLSAEDWGRSMIVFASNRVLAERCGGVEERTLRRRISRLEDAGLVLRRLSPNRKRYRVKEVDGSPALTFGIDLTPMAERLAELTERAEAVQRLERQMLTLKAKIRYRLFDLQKANHPPCPAEEAARLMLRRVCDISALIEVLEALPMPNREAEEDAAAPILSDSDRQNVRHIQKSDKDLKEKNSAGFEAVAVSTTPSQAVKPEDISLAECLDAVPSAVEFATRPIRSWPEAADLATGLAPALGIDPRAMAIAEHSLGRFGATLAVLGLTQAHHRIHKPSAYLTALSRRAEANGLDYVRMFRSLTAVNTHASLGHC